MNPFDVCECGHYASAHCGPQAPECSVCDCKEAK
jgi:hypothetical protein